MYGEIGGGVYIYILLRCLDIWVCDRFRRGGGGRGALGISLFLICLCVSVCAAFAVF